MLEVHDPSDGSLVGIVSEHGPDDARRALDCAAAAGPSWRGALPDDRARVLLDAAARLHRDRDRLAALITAEAGKPLREGRDEVDYAAGYLRWFAEEARRMPGRVRPAATRPASLMAIAKPVGVCLLVTPWNFPLAMAARKLAPALAAGCTAILKPAEVAPLSAIALVDVLVAGGMPTGAVTVLTTSRPDETLAPLFADDRLRKLSFTGSTRVGRVLLERAARGVLRCSMELGGNAPFVVLEDADLDSAVEGAMAAKLRNAGQACTAANRFIVVGRERAAQFAERLAERFGALRLGPGTDERSDVGPLITPEAALRVHALVTDAVAAGARPLCGAMEPKPRTGFYLPTVLAGVDSATRVAREEIFGPVAPVLAAADEREALRLADDTGYGLAAYVWSGDEGRGARFAAALDTGMAAVNLASVSDPTASFGGTKHSGLGREGGPQGLWEYLEEQSLVLASS